MKLNGWRKPETISVYSYLRMKDVEDKALERKYQRLLKKRQEIDEQIADTVKALEDQRTMSKLLEKFKADE